MQPRPPAATAIGTSRAPGSKFLGISPHAVAVRRLLRKSAGTDATVLITGESGVGKEIAAREIHRLSRRANGPFVAINCAAIPDNLIESELFGHEAGAFTDARHTRRGAFQQAEHGTLLLDEIGEMTLAAQPKLLRALESEEIMPVGAEKPHRGDVRLLASTNLELPALCDARGFRRDLYYRLCVIEIEIRPLRERIEDVDVLALHFLRRFSTTGPFGPLKIAPCGLRLLRGHSWPGNARELKHVIQRAVALSSGALLTTEAFDLGSPAEAKELEDLLQLSWRDAKSRLAEIYAQTLLRRHGGSVHDAAKEAGVTIGGFYKWLRRIRNDR